MQVEPAYYADMSRQILQRNTKLLKKKKRTANNLQKNG